jgi:hypothetical protein
MLALREKKKVPSRCSLKEALLVLVPKTQYTNKKYRAILANVD